MAGATSYHVTYSSNGKQSWHLAALDHAESSIALNNVDNAKSYIVGVRAKNAGGGSGWRNSPTAGPYTPPTPTPTPPAAPTGLTATAGDKSVALGWDDPSDSSITGYEYRMNHNDTGTGNLSGWGSWQSIAGSGATTFDHVLGGLTNGREYRIQLRAVNDGGAGVKAPNAQPWFVSATLQTPPPPVSDIPSSPAQAATPSLTATGITSTSITLTISDHTAAWRYRYTQTLHGAPYKTGSCSAEVAANTSSVSVASLAPGSDYTIKAYSDSSCRTELTNDLTDLEFSTPGVVLNASYLLVPEGGTYPHTVRLATEPTASVTVAITKAGDNDITADADPNTAGNQTSLTFTTANWSAPQTVTLAAAQDTDTVPQAGKGDGGYAYGETTLTYTATSGDTNYNGLTATLKGVEADDDVCQGTTAVGGATVTSGALVDECNLLLPGKDLINKTGNRVNNWDTGTAMNSWTGITVENSRVTKFKLGFAIYAGATGNLPNTIGGLTELTHLELQSPADATTPMPVPHGIGNLTKLTVLKIYARKWTGQIPSSLGNLTELETVYLDSNYLSGPIPASLGNLTKLEELWLTNSGLTGEIPASLGNLRSMKSLQIGGGRLTGSIPDSLGNLPNLNDPDNATAGIYLSGNYLTGCAPWGLRDYLGTDKINNQRDAAGNAVTLEACPPPPPELTPQPCETNGVTTLWLGYACYIKAGVQPCEDMALQGDSATVAHLLERGGSGVGVTEVMPYNPLGGRAKVKTTKEGTDQQNNTVVIELDTFAVDVIPFGIRDYSVSAPKSAVNSTFTLTARLHSPAHLSPDKYRKNGTDLARSWVQLTLPSGSGLTGNDHARGSGISDPVQVVGQYGDSATFTISTGSQIGTFDIAIKAYNPMPDYGCPLSGDPTLGALRCYAPPVGSEDVSYLVQSQVVTQSVK